MSTRSDAQQPGAEITELCGYIYAAGSRLLSLIREFDEQYRQREVTHYYDHDGCLVIKARLPAEQDALIVKALEMAMDVAFNDTDVYPQGTSTADQVPSGQASNIEDGPGVTAETSRRIACDSSLVRIEEDQNGEPLSIGRRSRSIPPPMRRALRTRDKGCRFPGCTNTRFVDGHHIRHWADGGETSLDNLVLLCRHHHHLAHEGGFACERNLDGEITFTDQRTQLIVQSPGLSGVATNDDIQEWMDREFFEAGIDSESCVSRWHAGERMDWQAAVSALF